MFTSDKIPANTGNDLKEAAIDKGKELAVNKGKELAQQGIEKAKDALKEKEAEAAKAIETAQKILAAAQQAQQVAQMAQAVISAANMRNKTGDIPGAGVIQENGSSDAAAGSTPENETAAAAEAASGVIHAVGLQIVIGGASYEHFHHFQLEQSNTRHHTFRLILAHDASGTAQEYSMEDARDYLGQSILVKFKYRNVEGGPEQNFKGVITQVGYSSEHGSVGNIVLSGQSPTVLLDAAPHIQSFTGMSLQSVAKKVIEQGVDDQQMKNAVKVVYTDTLPYTCQYNETHYNYLARMAAAYGEWFFYDGETLCFGKPAPPDPIKLIYGKDTHEVQVQLKAAHVAREHYGYNSSSHEPLTSSPTEIGGLGELGTHSYDQSKKIFKTTSLQVSPVRAVSAKDIKTTQKGRSGAVAAGLFTVSGSTSIPFLHPGALIEMNFRKPGSSDVKYFSRMLVTAVTHSLDIKGDYNGYFEAIPSDTEHLPAAAYKMPIAEPQIATVKDNKDSQGRVKVKFDWQQGDDMTDFIRMMAPDAGSSGKVSTNRGFMAVPEMEDQVMVGFVHNHPDRPFVMGGMFHGKVGAGGGSGNNVKSLSSKSGHTVKLDDGGGITVKDKDENVVFLDGAGNINVTSKETIVLKCGNSTIAMDKAGNILIKGKELAIVGENIGVSASTAVGIGVGAEGAAPSSGIGIKSSELNIGSATESVN